MLMQKGDIVSLQQARNKVKAYCEDKMKTFLVVLTILCTMVGVAKPTISYAPTHYVHDSSKISGLLSAGSLLAMQEPVLIGKNQLECTSIVHKVLSGKVGETIQCPIVIDDPNGIEEIKITSVNTNNSSPDLMECPLVFSHCTSLKEKVYSHMMRIDATIPEKVLSLTYSLTINGVEIKLPMILIPETCKN